MMKNEVKNEVKNKVKQKCHELRTEWNQNEILIARF